MNYKCPHNLFWQGLRLNLDKIQITDKALEIGNCCCLIDEPWTPEEIGEIWGMPMRRIEECESVAWRKVHKKCPSKQLKKPIFS